MHMDKAWKKARLGALATGRKAQQLKDAKRSLQGAPSSVEKDFSRALAKGPSKTRLTSSERAKFMLQGATEDFEERLMDEEDCALTGDTVTNHVQNNEEECARSPATAPVGMHVHDPQPEQLTGDTVTNHVQNNEEECALPPATAPVGMHALRPHHQEHRGQQTYVFKVYIG